MSMNLRSMVALPTTLIPLKDVSSVAHALVSSSGSSSSSSFASGARGFKTTAGACSKDVVEEGKETEETEVEDFDDEGEFDDDEGEYEEVDFFEEFDEAKEIYETVSMDEAVRAYEAELSAADVKKRQDMINKDWWGQCKNKAEY